MDVWWVDVVHFHRNKNSEAIMMTRVLLAALAVVVGAGSRQNGSHPPSSCLVNGGLPALRCAFYPRGADLMLYAGPSGDEVYAGPGWNGAHPAPSDFNGFVADPEDLDAGVGRVRIYHSLWHLQAWVNRKDIVRYSDLKRVKRCWPIRRLTIENGDAPEGTITLGRDGVGGGDAHSNLTGRVQAWYFEGAWSVRVIGRGPKYKEDGEVGWGNLDLANGKVIGRAPWSGGEELDPSMPASCASGVVVESDSP
jgi:hypothetical protein